MKLSVRQLWMIGLAMCFLVIGLGLPDIAWGQETAPEVPALGDAVGDLIDASDGEEVSTALRLIVMLSALSILPGVLMVMTPFTRFIIVFSLLRQGLGLQQSPPNQVLVGLAVIMSMMVMQPTLTVVNDTAFQPFMDGEIDTATAYDNAIGPMRSFMLRNMRRDDLATSMRLAKMTRPDTVDDIPTPVVITAFVLSELRTAFVIAVKVYIPFLVIDVIVASTLLGMGMMMLPPIIISMPFKLLIFVLMDGWALLVTGMAAGFS